ncbi:hypothetical protein D9753_01405 [Streptomyces dangxiongensis]|uniref:Beta-glucosidase n=1 Tax=Streptomyces dangxiongensis TaxID=1442032 RepID=A0A3G2JLU2_9ACTN|nr:hypothetical protein D9753_01405 [Streptomyces dangxiongensis]
MVRVDYDTQERTPKDSYRWYRAMIPAQPRRPGPPPLGVREG